MMTLLTAIRAQGGAELAGAVMITGELNSIKLAPASKPVRVMTHELMVRLGRAGGFPNVCPSDAQGVLRPHMISDGSKEHPTEVSTTGAPLEPHRSPIDDPTLGKVSRP